MILGMKLCRKRGHCYLDNGKVECSLLLIYFSVFFNGQPNLFRLAGFVWLANEHTWKDFLRVQRSAGSSWEFKEVFCSLLFLCNELVDWTHSLVIEVEGSSWALLEYAIFYVVILCPRVHCALPNDKNRSFNLSMYSQNSFLSENWNLLIFPGFYWPPKYKIGQSIQKFLKPAIF